MPPSSKNAPKDPRGFPDASQNSRFLQGSSRNPSRIPEYHRGYSRDPLKLMEDPRGLTDTRGSSRDPPWKILQECLRIIGDPLRKEEPHRIVCKSITEKETEQAPTTEDRIQKIRRPLWRRACWIHFSFFFLFVSELFR